MIGFLRATELSYFIVVFLITMLPKEPCNHRLTTDDQGTVFFSPLDDSGQQTTEAEELRQQRLLRVVAGNSLTDISLLKTTRPSNFNKLTNQRLVVTGNKDFTEPVTQQQEELCEDSNDYFSVLLEEHSTSCTLAIN